jgi:glyoxylase-like metal-dependent hydrolase (beta-lactamase superfamily II)
MMAAKKIVDGLWQIALGAVNVFVIDDDGIALIDTGLPNSAGKITTALRELGRQPSDVRRILVTHCHPDHAGSVAELKRITGAPAYMHALDAALVRRGESRRPFTPSPGLLPKILFRLFIGPNQVPIEPAEIDGDLTDGLELPIAGGIRVIHTPGHCAGHVALLWHRHRLLFVADAASNMLGLGLSIVYEDLQEGLRSLATLSALDFDMACFGHGAPLLSRASERFKKNWMGDYLMAGGSP